ncbi:hypothetical protein V8B55DRAFT_1407545 [Mucor lusitanicus]
MSDTSMENVFNTLSLLASGNLTSRFLDFMQYQLSSQGVVVHQAVDGSFLRINDCLAARPLPNEIEDEEEIEEEEEDEIEEEEQEEENDDNDNDQHEEEADEEGESSHDDFFIQDAPPNKPRCNPFGVCLKLDTLEY